MANSLTADSKLPKALRAMARTPSKGDGYIAAKLKPCGTLFLSVRKAKNGFSRSWVVVGQYNGKRFKKSIGTLEEIVYLNDAKAIAIERVKRYIETGGNLPFNAPAETAEKKTIGDLFPQWIEALTASKGEGHEDYIRRAKGQFRAHVLPVLGDRLPQDVTAKDTARLVEALQGKTSTARKVKTLMRFFFRWSIRQGHSELPNPAGADSLRDLLETKEDDRENHAAIPYTDIPRLIAALAAPGSIEHVGSRALLFAILNAGRAAMIRGVKGKSHALLWSEVSEHDEQGRPLMHLKADRMKVPKNGDFYAPLSRQSVALLEYSKQFIPSTAPGALVFPNSVNAPLCENTMTKRLKSLDSADREHGGPGFRDPEKTIKDKDGNEAHPVATQHATCRACFNSWARAEHPKLNREVIEMCLHHRGNDPYNGAYEQQIEQRFLDLRGKLLQEWADYCFSACEPDNPILHLMKNAAQ